MSFFIVPSYIIELPSLDLPKLKFFHSLFNEFQSNVSLTESKIKQITGIESESILEEYIHYFQSHRVIKKISSSIKGRAFFVQLITRPIEIRN